MNSTSPIGYQSNSDMLNVSPAPSAICSWTPVCLPNGSPTQPQVTNPPLGLNFCGTLGVIIGGVASLASQFFHTGKHKDQIARDQLRAGLQAVGLIDRNFKLQLADGSGYDIGLDGGYRYPNIDGTMRRAYEVDFSNPLAAEVINLVHPLSVLITGNDRKLRDDLTGYLVNAALSNAKDLEGARVNVQAFYAKLGMQPDAIAQGLAQLTQAGRVSSADYQVFLGGLEKVILN